MTRPLAAVTGATGFIGSALVERLLTGHRVRALVRTSDERTADWETRGCTTVAGSLERYDTLAALVAGVDVVYHLAATMEKGNPARSHNVNVDGTERVARAALQAGVRRFVYVSSISVFSATRRPDGTITEAVIPEHISRLNAYARTKYDGEMRVRALSTACGLEYTIARPTNVYGPGSGPWFHQFERMLQRVPVALGDIPIDIVHVDDVVRGLMLAATAPAAANATFHLGHEMVRLNDFIARVGQVTGRRARRLPQAVDRLLRGAIDRAYRMLTRTHMSMSLVREVRYPHAKASAAFGYRPDVEIREGFERLAQWYGSGIAAGRPASPSMGLHASEA